MKKILVLLFLSFSSFVYGQTSKIESSSNQDAQKEFQIYSNPMEDIVTITTIIEGYTLEVINQQGQVTLIETKNRGSRDFDYSNLPSGLYFLKLSTNEVSKTFKIVRL